MPFTSLDPRVALVVIDLQQGLAAMPLAHPFQGIVSRTGELVAAFRRQQLPVVWVTVDGAPPGRIERSRRVHSMPPGFAELLPALDVQPGDHRVMKQTPGAFTRTDLEAYLRRQQVTQIVLVGVSTTSGVESTARQAYELGFNVSFVVDAMSDLDGDAHDNSVVRIFPKLGESGATQDLLNLLQRSA